MALLELLFPDGYEVPSQGRIAVDDTHFREVRVIVNRQEPDGIYRFTDMRSLDLHGRAEPRASLYGRLQATEVPVKIVPVGEEIFSFEKAGLSREDTQKRWDQDFTPISKPHDSTTS